LVKRSTHLVVFTSIITAILKIGLLIALAFMIKGSGIVFSWGLALIITLTISFLWLLPRAQTGYKAFPELDISLLKALGKYSIGSYVASLFSQAPSMVLPLLVLNILGAQSNAYFYVAWTIAGFMSAIPMSISRSLFVEGVHSARNIKKNVIKSLKSTFMLSIPAVIVMGLAAKWILLAFGPGYSANALALVWIMSVANVLRGFYTIYISLLRIQDRLKELVLIQSINSATIIILSYLAIKTYGVIGVGYAWLLVQIFLALFIGFRLARQLPHLPNNETGSSQ
jgi:O-antigen/teichoic acid export membrane protein